MADVTIGDMLQSGGDPATFSSVVAFSHRLHGVRYHHFVTIDTDNRSTLTLSDGHYPYARYAKRGREVT